MTINEYFDQVICINIRRRTDRLEHVRAQCEKHKLDLEIFYGADMLTWGNNGCTLSHRLVMERIIEKKWGKTLVLEDDFEFRFDDSQERFSAMIQDVPVDWELLYLGGHYGGPPVKRISAHVIQCGAMKTTSSYGITLAQAEKMAPSIRGVGPIDDLFTSWCLNSRAYIFQPRLIVQYMNYSDLQQRVCNNSMCMEDVSHENSI